MYKMNHSILLWIHLFIPILGAGIFLLYYKISLWQEYAKISAYLQVLAVVFPLLIGLITVIHAEQEAHAGGFQEMLSMPRANVFSHVAKILVFLFYGLIASLIAFTGFGVVFSWMGYKMFALSLYLSVGLLLFLSTIPLYFIHYLLAFTVGKSLGIGVGIAGFLLSALLVTGLGDVIWIYLPWGISGRFSNIFLECARFNVSVFTYPGMIGAIFAYFVMLVALVIVFVLWGNRWEGRAHIDG